MIFKNGDRVRDREGNEWTVMKQDGPNGCQVFVYGMCFGWFHPSYLTLIERK